MKRLVYESQGSQYFQAVKDVQQLDGDMQRFLYFSKRVLSKHSGSNTFTYSKVYWNDDNELVYVSATYKVMLSKTNKVFLTNTLNAGFKFRPDKGIEFWKGMKFCALDSATKEAIYRELGCEWVLDGVPSKYSGHMNYYYGYFLRSNAIINRVLRKRITNPLDLVRAFLSNDGKWRDLKLRSNAALVLKLAKQDKVELEYIFECLQVEENPSRLLQWFATKESHKCEFQTYYHHGDLRWELVRLGKKINCNWSHKRLDELHTRCSRDIREMELKYMDTIKYPYSQPCPMIPNMELIDTNLRLWEEGSIMSHCIYSYLQSAIERRVFHFHGTFGGEDFSLAVQEYRKWVDEEVEYVSKFEVQQMHQAYNKSCTPEQRIAINDWLSRTEVQQWFANEVKVYEEEVKAKQQAQIQAKISETQARVAEVRGLAPGAPAPLDDLDDLPF
jgi:hypothetical protein